MCHLAQADIKENSTTAVQFDNQSTGACVVDGVVLTKLIHKN